MRGKIVSMALIGALSGALSYGGAAHAAGTESSAGTKAPAATRPIVIGHRGASGYRPEHTRGAYTLAVRLGADWIEPDLVPTKDHQLVVRHENEISGTTDVADHPRFADRKTTKTIDGRQITGWFTEDFTLKELKRLRAKERLPDVRPGNTRYDGRWPIMTLQEVIDLAKRLSRKHRRTVGVIPETKHPTYFRSIGLPLEEKVIRTIKRNRLDRPDERIVVQSFEPQSLKRMRRHLRVSMMQNIGNTGGPFGHDITYDEMVTPEGLRDIAKYAQWIAPEKRRVIALKDDGSVDGPTTLVADARRAGLRVCPYTFRNENQFLPTDLRIGDDPNAHGDAIKEYRLHLEAGIAAMYSDFPDTAREAISSQR